MHLKRGLQGRRTPWIARDGGETASEIQHLRQGGETSLLVASSRVKGSLPPAIAYVVQRCIRRRLGWGGAATFWEYFVEK